MHPPRSMKLMKWKTPDWTTDAGLLFMRVSVGSMMLLGHGQSKLLGFSEKAATFSDPLGVGSTTSLVLAIVGEVVASLFVIFGLGTRFFAVPLLVTMLVAALIVHAEDPWGRKEFALLYAVPALTLILTGAGRFSLDELLWRRREKAPAHSSPASPRS